MAYVDGFVLPVPKKNLDTYLAMARKASAVWREHGALEYREAVGEDLDIAANMPMMPFPRLTNMKNGETVVFAWVVYESRAHRDEVNAKVMNDPRITEDCGDGSNMPFDVNRMAYGGFEIRVES